MINFKEYIEHVNRQPLVMEIAQIISEMEQDPDVILMKCVEETNPELFYALDEAGFWNNVWGAAKDAGQSIKQGAQAWGAKTHDRFAGPHAKIQSIMASVDKLVKMMQNDPELAKVSGGGGTEIATMLDNLKQKLQTWHDRIPQMGSIGAQSTRVGTQTPGGQAPTYAGSQAPAGPNVVPQV